MDSGGGVFVGLSRRERQILDILYAEGGATVAGVRLRLPEAPTPMAVRRLLQIMEEKGHVRRRKEGREYVYEPLVARDRAGRSALAHVIETFFGGSMEDALAAHLGRAGVEYSEEELRRMARLIEEARKRGD